MIKNSAANLWSSRRAPFYGESAESSVYASRYVTTIFAALHYRATAEYRHSLGSETP